MKTLVLSFICVFAWASPNRFEEFHKAKTLLSEGYQQTSIPKIERARQMFSSLAKNDKGFSSVYYQAFANYRILNCLNMQGKQDYKDQAAFLNEAIELLESIPEGDPLFQEANVLLHNLYGRKVGFKPLTGMVLFKKMKKIAAQQDPNNPRWSMLEAIFTYYAPTRFGGDKTKAIAQVERAIQLFESNPSPVFHKPSWGREDAYAWLGIMHAEMGDHNQARVAYEKGLRVAPNFSWIKTYLEPQLPKPTLMMNTAASAR